MTLPTLFEQRMRRLLGTEYAALFENWQKPLTTRGLRVNTLKTTVDALLARLPFSVTPAVFSPDAFITDADFRAGSDPLHHAGAYYMQEPSALSAVRVLAPKRGETVLDLCAAPGGKSTQIAAALSGEGLLWCNEYVPARARILRQNLERCGVRNSVVSVGDTAAVADALPAFFDAVLADVPCSGEGMFRKEEAALSEWSEDNVRLCAERSRGILDNAAKTVRGGGRLVLSTCTFAPEENECAVIRFLHDHPDFYLADCGVSFGRPACSTEQILPFLSPELHDFARTVDTTRCRRVFPADGGEGHFVALFYRDGTAAPSALAFTPDKKDREAAFGSECYATCFKDAPNGYFATFGDTIHLLPLSFPHVRGVSILSAGLPVATLCGDRTRRAEPTHAAFLAASPDDCRSVIRLELDDPRTTAFLRGEEIAVDGGSGFTAVVIADMVVGFGKVSGGRLKNRYPKGLRLIK